MQEVTYPFTPEEAEQTLLSSLDNKLLKKNYLQKAKPHHLDVSKSDSNFPPDGQ